MHSNKSFPKYILASYPRSANHWIRYIIEFLSKQPTLGEGNNNRDRKDPPIFKRFGLEDHYDITEPIAIKRHIIRKADDRSSQMIFVIRDYREVIYRHIAKPFSIYRLSEIEKNIRMYRSLIKHYEDWPSRKLLVSYEDLINRPKESIKQIAHFIEKTNGLHDLLENLDKHQSTCINMYDEYTGSKTKGKSTNFHSKQYGKGWKQYLDFRLKKDYEKLFNSNTTKGTENLASGISSKCDDTSETTF
jgi:hypothetical protein